jgi:RNA polymerase sigma-70 factor, ECF subfamily
MNLEPVFASERPRLLALAYRMLGTVAEAEDIVQDAFTRCADLDAETIRSAPALLTTMVTRLSINALHSARHRREHYVGPWMPEPIVTHAEIDPASVSLAFMVLLEALTPTERAAFVLHKVFDYSHEEIATALGIEVASSRQLVHRAKQHIEQRRPRFRADPEAHARLFTAFGEACRTGDLAGLEALLSDDVVVTSDHGGKATAIRRPVVGPDHAARLMLGLTAKIAPTGAEARVLEINGALALVLVLGNALFSVVTLETDGEHICAINMVRNPDKLAPLAAANGLTVLQ